MADKENKCLLQYNNIASIKSETFHNLTNLYQIYLQHNKITLIQSDMFNNLPNLYKLILNNNPISFVSGKAFENLPKLAPLEFDMHGGGCDNIPFWRWLKETQTYPTSSTCNDFDGEFLTNLQPYSVIGCSASMTVGTETSRKQFFDGQSTGRV